MLQEMFSCFETELMWLDMCINAKKVVCIRFGRRYDTDCFQLLTAKSDIIEWVNSIWYLGIYFVSGQIFKCNWLHTKSSYYRSFIAIFGRI